MPAFSREPRKEPVSHRFIGSGELFQNAGKVAIWKMWGDEDASVLRQMHGTPCHLHNFGGPVPAPRHPRLVQRPKVLDVMGDERPPVFGCTEKNLNVSQSAAAKFFGRIDVPALRAEQTSKPVGNIFVEDDPHVRHALRKSGRVCLEQGVDGASMLFVIEQSRLHSLIRNIIGLGGFGDHLIGDSGRLGRSRYGSYVPDNSPDRHTLGQDPATRRSGSVRVWAYHSSQMIGIGNGGALRSVGGWHGVIPVFRHPVVAKVSSCPRKA